MTKEQIKQLLRERGIEVNIDGCGCCGSPNVAIKIDGEVEFDSDYPESTFSMFDGKEPR